MRFDAVIFDLDGTLLDTLRDIADATNSVLASSGLPAHAVEAYRFFVGDGVRKLVERALGEDRRDDATVERLVEEFRAAYAKNWNATTRPYDGVPAMLDALVARGLKLAVLSNKPDDFTRECVETLLSSWRFDVVRGQRDDTPPKPDPAGAALVLRALDAEPARVLYLGDSNVDMKTALAAGVFPVGALWGFRTRAELEAAGAEAVAEHPRDVVALVDGGGST